MTKICNIFNIYRVLPDEINISQEMIIEKISNLVFHAALPHTYTTCIFAKIQDYIQCITGTCNYIHNILPFVFLIPS